jgi:protein SCO1
VPADCRGADRSTPRASALTTWLSGLSALLVAVLGSGCAATSSSGQAQTADPAGVIVSTVLADTTYHGAEPRPPYRMPDVTLTDTDGKPFNLVTDTTRRVTLVFFGYTYCPDVCPLVMSDLTAALLRLPAAVRARTQMLFITTDPARDTPSALRSYLDRYNPRFVGLTGSLSDIRTAGRALGVPIEGKHRLPSGGYDVAHGTSVIGFRGDTAPVVWTQGTPVTDLAADITRLAQPSPG